MNELIAFYSKDDTANEYGTLANTRTLIAEAFASVRPLSGSERNQSDQTEAHASFRFTIHYRTDIDEDTILVWNGKDYNIKWFADMPKEPYMYIDAERGGAM